jgi:ParB family chromosome partitioning protein
MSKATKPKSRLGRGLSSLISVTDLPVEVELPPEPPAAAQSSEQQSVSKSDAVMEIDIESISANPSQPRQQINEASIVELASSIKTTGLVQPIVVRKAGAGYQLIAGERRLRAARHAGLKRIPSIVREVDHFTQAQMALVENIQREDLNPIERAHAYRALMEQLGLTQAELANRLGEDRSSIANFLRLLDLCEYARDMLRERRLSLGHAKVLAGVTDVLEQQRLAELVVGQDLTVRNLERMISQEPATPQTRASPGVSAHLLDLEKSITRQLGMRTQVRGGGKGKGRLIIHYASLDQFDDILGRLGVKVD